MTSFSPTSLIDTTRCIVLQCGSRSLNMAKKKINITANMTIGDILKEKPQLAEIFLGFGMHCISCPISLMETVEEAAMVHDVDLEFLLKKLNENK